MQTNNPLQKTFCRQPDKIAKEAAINTGTKKQRIIGTQARGPRPPAGAALAV